MSANSAGADAGAPATVRSWHVLAEHVLGAGRYAATGHIGLQVASGGFGTPVSDEAALGGRFIVSGTSLVLARSDGSRPQTSITTVRAAAAFFGVVPGMPPSVYTPATPLDLDAPLDVDPAVATRIGAWFELGDEALTRFAEHHPDEDPTRVTLWPEHFDLACSMSEVNYGVSPGDDGHAEPYLYVGPWTPRTGAFWNEPFGASVSAAQIGSVDDAIAFFEQGRSLAPA